MVALASFYPIYFVGWKYSGMLGICVKKAKQKQSVTFAFFSTTSSMTLVVLGIQVCGINQPVCNRRILRRVK